MCRQKSLPAGSQRGTVEGGADWERLPLLQRNSECSGTLVQVFWWIRLALYRESVHSGTKKRLGAGGGGKTRHQTPAGILTLVWSSNHRGLAWERRTYGPLKKRESWLFHTFLVRPNDKLSSCWHVSSHRQGKRQPYTPVSITNRCFFIFF